MIKKGRITKEGQIIEKLNKPLRKVAYAGEYVIFAILILIALKNIIYSMINRKMKLV